MRYRYSAGIAAALLVVAFGTSRADVQASPATPAQVEEAGHKTIYTRESLRGVLCGDEDKNFRRSGIQGTAYFVIHVGKDGRADEVRTFHSSATPRLDAAMAVCLIQREKFKPALEDGAPVDSWQFLVTSYKPR